MNLLISSSLVVLLSGADVPTAAVQAITAGYQGAVEQAFAKHCADCHGKLPENLPAEARMMAEKKSRKAHKRMNMDEGFPFRSKWTLPKLMAEIREVIEDDDMPPKKYMKKKGQAISDQERRAIANWAKDAVKALAAQ